MTSGEKTVSLLKLLGQAPYVLLNWEKKLDAQRAEHANY